MLERMHIYLIIMFVVFVNKANSQLKFDTYALQKIDVIDVIGGDIIENQTIVIENNMIAGIYDSDEFNNPDSIQLLDFDDHYIIPGLIDAHVHLGTNPSKGDNLEINKKRLDHLLKNGVTTVRDMAGDARFLAYLSRQASLDLIPSPDIYFSALIAGETFFKDPRTKAAAQGMESGKAAWMRGINASSDLNQIIAEAKGTGATGIKIYADLDKKYVQKVTEEAHAQDLKVWAHATVFPAKPSEVCQSGVDVMSHATYLAWEEEKDVPSDASFRSKKHEDFNIDNPDFLELVRTMKQNETILDATLCVYKRYFPDSTLYQYGVLMTKLAYQNQVKVGVGTDLSLDEFSEDTPIYQEMAALHNDVGMKAIDAIRGATIVNAEMLGKENEIGSIEIGKKANLVILKKNPIQDISNIKSHVFVIKNGRMFNTY